MAEIYIPFVATVGTTDEKKQLLNHFLSEVPNPDGYNNTHKFLYLFGDETTGKMPLLKEVAEEVFGENWETKIYIREDKGQKFPYKLHAHKVESSRKVVIVTNSREHWLKWKDLYPMTQAFEFVNLYIPANQHTRDNLPTNFRQYDMELFKQNLREIIDDTCRGNGLSSEVSFNLKARIIARVNEMLYL